MSAMSSSVVSRGASVRAAHLEEVLDLARQHLHMEIAFVSEVGDGHQTFRVARGDTDSFGIRVGDHVPLIDTWCSLMLEGLLGNVVPNVAEHPLLNRIRTTATEHIGAYAAVPLRLRNGEIYGTLCCLAGNEKDLTQRDVQFLNLLADVLADDLQAERDSSRLLQRIETLLDADRFATAFQPIVDVNDNRCLGFEALTRFPPGYGPPDHVFDLAHSVGLGAELEAAAVRQALGAIPRLGDDHYLSVNITPDVAVTLAEQASGRESMYHRIVIEITERAAVSDYPRLRQSLDALRERGIRLAVDDAGSGWASLHHVIELQPDIIKIDRSLIHGLPGDRFRRSAVRAFASVAVDIDATTVAEGIETTAELDVARTLGINAAQGYYIARPDTDLDALNCLLTRPRTFASGSDCPF